MSATAQLNPMPNISLMLSFNKIVHMWLMIGHKSDKCDMRVLRVPVTWFLYFCTKIPTRDPCDMRDMCDMHDIGGTFGPL